MTALFTWLDAHPAAYWLLGSAALGLLAAWAWATGRRPDPRPGPKGFADVVAGGLLLVVLLAWRWPLLLEVGPGGVTESQLLASAMAMADDAVPFRGADPGTSGLLAGLILLPTHWLGIPQDYFNARLVALLLDWGTLVVGYCALRRFLGGGDAMLGLLPVAMAFATFGGKVPGLYAPWHLTLLLTVAGGLVLWRLGGPAPAGRLRPALAAICLGLIPWTSRPGLLVAVGVWIIAAGLARRSPGPAGATHLRNILLAGAVALYGNAVFVCWLHGIGRWERFWTSYVCAGMQGSLARPETTGLTFWPVGVVIGAIALCWWRIRTGRKEWCAAGSMLLAGSTLAAHGWQGTPETIGRLAGNWRHPYSDLALRIRASRQPGNRLAIWGTQPQLYVETGLRPATTSAVWPESILADNPRREFQRSRYLAELRETKPAFFVDAGTRGLAGYEDRAKGGYQTFPRLAEYIENSYRLESDDGHTRLYLLHFQPTGPAISPDTTRLSLAKIRILQATGVITDMGETRWFAHAPSRFAQALPRDAVRLSGAFGFIPTAYQDASTATDGATFVIEAVGPAGLREVLLKKRLTPTTDGVDRGPHAFSLELPQGATATELEFSIHPGEGNRCDWTYWDSLQFNSATTASQHK